MIKYILLIWVMTFGTIVIMDNTPCIGQYGSSKKCFMALSSLVLTVIFLFCLVKLLFGV